MASAEELRSLEESCPWLQADFQADLALVADGTAASARQYAAELRVIARLAGRVPRCAFDETGATPWTCFRREIALARKLSDRAAGQLVRAALRLTSALPRAMGLLETGVLTVGRADALVAELDGTGGVDLAPSSRARTVMTRPRPLRPGRAHADLDHGGPGPGHAAGVSRATAASASGDEPDRRPAAGPQRCRHGRAGSSGAQRHARCSPALSRRRIPTVGSLAGGVEVRPGASAAASLCRRPTARPCGPGWSPRTGPRRGAARAAPLPPGPPP